LDIHRRESTSMATHPHSDADTSLTLMMRIQQNPADPEAWDEFVQRYRPLIRAWCLRWGSQPSDADDVSQEVLLKLLKAMKTFQFDPSRSFRAWLKTVTQNAWHDFVSARRLKLLGSDQPVDGVADTHDALADLEKQMDAAFDRELLELAMRRIEKRVKSTTWEAFRLTALENRSGAEAAARLQLPVAHVFIAKHRVQKMLEEEVRMLRRE
jgi:RNA polymerase sigma-70 factor (ECF subfamily)